MYPPSVIEDVVVQQTDAHEVSLLRKKIEDRTAVIGVIGLGYVGLPIAVEYAQRGFTTVGIDLDSERVLRLNSGKNYIQDVDDEVLGEVVKSGHFVAQDDYAVGADVDVFVICVPTPVTINKDPDVNYIRSAAKSIAPCLRSGQLVILKSTTYPETTEKLVQPILESVAQARGLKIGRDYFLAHSPERIDPGNKQFTTANTPIVVGGVTPACTHLASLAMRQIVDRVHTVSSPKVAEMEKLLENIFRSVNIALVNELARLCDRMGGISIWEVVEAAATKPFGYMPFYPGPGLGGHCIPVDPYFLSWMARRYDFETSFITLSARTNEDMPYYVRDAVIAAVADQGVRRDDAKILVLGVSFKRDVDDTRHSPALKVMELLITSGFKNLTYSDPHVPNVAIPTNRDTLRLESQALSDEMIAAHDAVVLLTDHAAFPYSQIARNAPVIVDTRNAFRDVPHDRDKILVLGGGTF